MEIVFRAAVIYVFLCLVTKAMGKRELAQMSSFELILLVTMGDLIQQAVTQEDRSITGGLIAVSTMTVIIMAVSWLTYRSRSLRSVVEGQPVIVVRDGRVLQEALRTERLAVEELHDAAREQGISDLRGVRYGILEADGRFSFLLVEHEDQQQRVQAHQELS
jgi:uncharacterized membrane protein YcaP (DUF421 family)